MKISTVFFDLGKVLLDFDFNIAYERIAAKSPLTMAQLRDTPYTALPLVGDYERGRVSTAEFFAEMQRALSFSGGIAELEKIWCEIFTPLTVNIECARSLSAAYPLGIISNTCDAHIRHAEARYDFFELFPARIYSHEAGSAKPEPEIYRAALRAADADAAECLFIDDLAANISGAAALGFNVIHLQPDTDLRAALREFGLAGL